MSAGHWLLTPADLEEAPCLAILELLRDSIRLADVVITLDHPALLDSELPSEPLDQAAYDVVAALWALHRAIKAYRDAVDGF